MSAPKSVVKIKTNKNGCKVEYTSNCDATQYYVYELTRAALRDVGKFVSRVFRNRFYSRFKRFTGNAGRVTQYQVISGAKTQYPRVQIGIKTGRVDGFYAYFQEVGTKKIPKLGILQSSVKDNVAEIVKIESQYLSALEGEAEKLEALINENDMGGDADE